MWGGRSTRCCTCSTHGERRWALFGSMATAHVHSLMPAYHRHTTQHKCSFWHKFLFDQGLTRHKEPFHKLVHQGKKRVGAWSMHACMSIQALLDHHPPNLLYHQA